MPSKSSVFEDNELCVPDTLLAHRHTLLFLRQGGGETRCAHLKAAPRLIGANDLSKDPAHGVCDMGVVFDVPR